ncbi:Six-hairpin glycosidase-like protein [Catenaria anguillulae PL171]|uniref:Six-hairpin glycosidase-like protein n=1 Tax=Catenaria anguillulae PL171 TaxID=765915 RepID=A0A1Y2HIC1_9FUNG|nr:Six-hairpin glycosidase-like protein [Catenaria anguillulae PL171]
MLTHLASSIAQSPLPPSLLVHSKMTIVNYQPLATPADVPVLKHNAELAPLILDDYKSKDEILAIWSALNAHKTLRFPSVEGRGLFKAALSENTDDGQDYTGYDNVWVRDTIHVAHALYLQGESERAVAAIKDLARFWFKYRCRFTQCIRHEVDFNANPMVRPHIRFNGSDLRENDQTWAHAQNDAMGYTVWFTVMLAREAKIDLLEPLNEQGNRLVDLLVLQTLYLRAVQFWQDEDSGHWEEARKVESSSIGPVVAAMRDLAALLESKADVAIAYQTAFSETVAELDAAKVDANIEAIPLADKGLDVVRSLQTKGKAVLDELLPYESVSPKANTRDVDAAQLFLVYPLNVIPVTAPMARTIVERVVTHLAGDYGIRRYRGDSYWAADYKTLFDESTRTADFSDDMSVRDSKLKPGQEAQWCIFDSIVSCIYGEFANNKAASEEQRANDRALQVKFFNRAIGQVTGEECAFGPWEAPESYYIEKGVYVSNDVCPLLWTMANLVKAMKSMIATLEN